MRWYDQEFFKKHRWEWIGLILIISVVVINRFPEGYVIAGEDLFQHINLQEHFRQMFYDWQGRASLYYSLFYLLDRLYVSETVQLSWNLGIFLVGSYVSFLCFLRLVFRNISSKIAVVGSLFYTFNLYTLYVFTYTWGYSDFQILYAFIPVITGVYITFLRSWQTRYGALFLLLIFFASSGFSNPAFALSFFLFLVLLTIFFATVRIAVFDRFSLIRLLVLGALSFLVSAYWIFPVIPQVINGVTDLAETNSIDLNMWLQKTSNPISETVRLGQFNSGSFFPRNNPYVSFDFIEPLILALSFLPMMMILIGVWRDKNQLLEHKKYFVGFFSLLVIFVALNARVRPPFAELNNVIFHVPGLNTLRSYEKIAIFTPFLLAVLFVLTLMRSWVGRWRWVMLVAVVLILLLPLPFYTGKLQQNMSFIFAQRSKNFQKSSHSFLVKIPQPYYDIRSIINSDSENFKIASLPYNTDKRGWVSYPEWKMRGSDITAALYKAPLINPNGLYVEQWLFANDFNELNDNPLWVIELLGILNTKYIIYHKDIHDEFIEKSLEKVRYLKSSGAIIEISDTAYFTLYKIKDEYVAPYVYLNSGKATINSYSIQGILDTGKDIRTSWKHIRYRIVHPKKIVVAVSGEPVGRSLVLSERYDTLWRAVYRNNEGSIVLKRDSSVTYANAWLVDEKMKKGSITIEYLPMKLFFVGAWVSGGVLSSVVLYFIYNLYGRRRKGNNIM